MKSEARRTAKRITITNWKLVAFAVRVVLKK